MHNPSISAPRHSAPVEGVSIRAEIDPESPENARSPRQYQITVTGSIHPGTLRMRLIAFSELDAIRRATYLLRRQRVIQ